MKTVVHFVVTSNIALQRCEHNQDIINSNGNWSEKDVLCMKYILKKKNLIQGGIYVTV